MPTSNCKIARQLGIDKSGYRVITNINSDGGQEVYHLHYHLLRWREVKRIIEKRI